MPIVVRRKVIGTGPVVSEVFNPSFETPVLTDPFEYPTGNVWTFSGCGMSKNGSGYTVGNPPAPDGAQVAFIQKAGYIQQTCTLTAGSHTVAAKMAQRGNFNEANQTVQLLIDGTVIGAVTPSGTSYSDYQFPSFDIASGGSHTLRLRGVSSLDATVLVDHIRLDVVIVQPGGLGATILRTNVFYPGQTGIQAAINSSLDDDTISVVPGVYTEHAAVGVMISVNRNNLTLKSATPGVKWVIDAQGREDHGITSQDGRSYTIEDCEIRNIYKYTNTWYPAGVGGQTGVQNVTLRRCYIHDTHQGLKFGTSSQSSNVLLEDCQFCDNGWMDQFYHNIYVDDINSFTMRGCWSRMSKARGDSGVGLNEGSWGHLVKSRARTTVIEGCRLTMEHADANRCLDLPNGGDVTIRGNLIELCSMASPYASSYNQADGHWYTQLISYGVEGGTAGFVNRFRCEQNTLVNHFTNVNAQILAIQVNTNLPSGIVDWSIRDNVVAGINKISIDGVVAAGYIWRRSGSTNVSPGTMDVSETDNTVITQAGMTAAMPNHAYPTLDFTLATPVTGSANWATVAYGHPTSHFARTDTFRGGVPGGVGTLVDRQWTPAKDGVGNVTSASWAQLPLNTVVEWLGTSLEGNLSPPYGIVGGSFADLGSPGISAVFDAWCGAAFDDATGRFWIFGGGHHDSSNNMVAKFEAAKGTWSIACPPTNAERFPPPYAGQPGFQYVTYSNGHQYDYFEPAESPAGDNKPCATHTYGGLHYCDGQMIHLRVGGGSLYQHLSVDAGTPTWSKGAHGARNMGAIEQRCVYYNGILYWAVEGSMDGQYWTITKYNVATRLEVGTFGQSIPFSTAQGSALLPGNVWWFANYGMSPPSYQKINLATQGSIGSGALTGRIPGSDSGGGGGNGGEIYSPELGKILTLSVWAPGTGAAEMVWTKIDPNTGACAIATEILDPSPSRMPTQLAPSRSIYGRMRYWSAKKVLIWLPRTLNNSNGNARVIRLG
jgi:Right handed beta helix region